MSRAERILAERSGTLEEEARPLFPTLARLAYRR